MNISQEQAPVKQTTYADVVAAFRVVVRNLWLLALIVGIGAVLTYAFLKRQPRIYEASATVVISPNAYPIEDGGPEKLLLSAMDVSRFELVGTYVQFLRSRDVRDAAKASVVEQGIPRSTMKGAVVEVQPVENSFVLSITVRAENAQGAQALANAVGEQVILFPPLPRVATLYPLEMLDAAELPTDPVSPQMKLGMLLGVAASLVLAIGIAFTWDGYVATRKQQRAAAADAAES